MVHSGSGHELGVVAAIYGFVGLTRPTSKEARREGHPSKRTSARDIASVSWGILTTSAVVDHCLGRIVRRPRD